ncbi:1916_t:CDS:2 [Funneliformis geosporum]|uniref:1916_t:CDS:1 n=1 Tax=Funneliformis geosporum TaxID=1117311 RepID=A0A9W4SFH8_9GLOM|nr:1916_t:CDS:2 [Funneliformis geosporum]
MDQIETDDDNILAKESSSLSEEPPNKKHKLREYLRISLDKNIDIGVLKSMCLSFKISKQPNSPFTSF